MNRTFDEIFSKKITTIEKVASKYCCNNQSEKDDLIQEGLIGLIAAIENFDENRNCSFDTYSNKCIKNRMLSYIYRQNKRNEIYEIDFYDISEKLLKSSCALSSEEIFLANEAKNELEKFIVENLSNLEYNVLNFKMQGYSYKEISFFLSKSEKTVDRALQRGRKKILVYLKENNNG